MGGGPFGPGVMVAQSPGQDLEGALKEARTKGKVAINWGGSLEDLRKELGSLYGVKELKPPQNGKNVLIIYWPRIKADQLMAKARTSSSGSVLSPSDKAMATAIAEAINNNSATNFCAAALADGVHVYYLPKIKVKTRTEGQYVMATGIKAGSQGPYFELAGLLKQKLAALGLSVVIPGVDVSDPNVYNLNNGSWTIKIKVAK